MAVRPPMPWRRGARVVGLGLALLGLAGCFDAEIALRFEDTDTVGVLTGTEMGLEHIDLALTGDPAQHCPGGEASVDEDTFRCEIRGDVALADLMNGAGTVRFGETILTAEEGFTLTQDSPDRFTVSYDLMAMFGLTETGQPAIPIVLVEGVIWEDHGLVLRIEAPAIIETTGTLSDDGRVASVYVPFTEVEAPGADLPPFITTLSIAETSQ